MPQPCSSLRCEFLKGELSLPQSLQHFSSMSRRALLGLLGKETACGSQGEKDRAPLLLLESTGDLIPKISDNKKTEIVGKASL